MNDTEKVKMHAIFCFVQSTQQQQFSLEYCKHELVNRQLSKGWKVGELAQVKGC